MVAPVFRGEARVGRSLESPAERGVPTHEAWRVGNTGGDTSWRETDERGERAASQLVQDNGYETLGRGTTIHRPPFLVDLEGETNDTGGWRQGRQGFPGAGISLLSILEAESFESVGISRESLISIPVSFSMGLSGRRGSRGWGRGRGRCRGRSGDDTGREKDALKQKDGPIWAQQLVKRRLEELGTSGRMLGMEVGWPKLRWKLWVGPRVII
ncbi:hypothetical protein Salat_0660600 [Sesamum alatum]|uniref:Uncharacterized protein n=1 Tax=Sesamum alatum TaxID=300844 RepID=A0AAE2CUE1_9LAMI|nr:hypothetical protein Salat_0660600 [Sesamum alatum]